ncbi:ATP-binding cassette domain-containing protein [Novosphingobium rosa]|uniref:ATP-binding cassette domain-containing protein n=1 Tax=Novosphingobium rosa TaxID=76978 RepID=UPI000829A74E|nr:ATP-binding cassette domain-containing protein [Novosphingobium rosa]
MSAFLTLDAIALATPAGRPLFSSLSLAVGRERIGVVGRNGTGKSSLLRAILGEIPLQAGSLAIEGTVGLLRQTTQADNQTACEALGLAEHMDILRRIETGIADDVDFEQADWSLPQRLEKALLAAGLPVIDLERPLGSFSGGERTRIAIAGLLLDPPDLLLLDEPTNNLDQDGRNAVIALLASWRGGALVVSHDRDLLEGMDRILSLSPTDVAIHTGGWSSWAAKRDAAAARAEAELQNATRQLRSARREAQQAHERQARRDSAGRAYGASGSAPAILLGRQRERAENSGARGAVLSEQKVAMMAGSLASAREKVDVIAPLTMAMSPCGLPSHRLLIAFEDVCWQAGERKVIDTLSFELRGPERVALSGRNGAGKTSVFKLAAGLLTPTSGRIQRSDRLAWLDQSVGMLDRAMTLVENIRHLNPALDENAARAALARFAFRNKEGERLVRDLSGGECLRAGLACVLSAQPIPQLLMLDEPTNHLDLDSIEVIEQALCAYNGALLVVSHDPRFLEAIGVTRHIAL